MLQKLDLSYNHLVSLPNEFASLLNLKYLDLSNNKLESIPPSIGKLQHLEVLNLSNNALTTFPAIIGQLSQLKVLKLKGNQLHQLSPVIAHLKHLEVLDIGFNPLDTLPDELKQLTSLTKLICTSNQWKTFPEVLLEMEYLESIEELDLNFRLKLPIPKLKLLFKVLRHLRKQKASLEVKRAAFELLFTGAYRGRKEHVYPLLLIQYTEFAHIVRTYIIKQYHSPLNKQCQIAVLGRTKWMDWEDLSAHNSMLNKEITSNTTHLVLGQYIRKKMLKQIHPKLFFISERELLMFLYPKQPANWLEEHQEKVLDLLLSAQDGNIALGVQLLKDNELSAKMLTELLLAYTYVSLGNTPLRNDIKALFYRNIPNFESINLPSAAFQFYTPNKSEHAIFQGIKNITDQCPLWDGCKIAHYLFDHYGVAYSYILEYNSLAEAQEWLEQFVNNQTITLGSLSKLKQLPQALLAFPNVSKLDLKGCSFRKFPNVELLKQLPNLEEIDLRDNPIAFIPRTLFRELSKYKILLSKST